MTNGNHLSFENDFDRGKYARELTKMLEDNGLNWKAYPSARTEELFIRPKNDPEWEKFPAITRISIQAKEGSPSFGVSGYQPRWVRNIREKYEAKGYNYHDKGHTLDGRPNGRWWLTKTLPNLDSLAGELKDIEPLLYEKIL